MKNQSIIQSTKDDAYARFGRGRFDVVSGSKLSRILTHAGQSILDVGCGPGAYIRTLRERGYQVDGVEGNDIMADEAMTTGATIYRSDLDEKGLSFIEDNSYDTVICLDVLEHLYHPSVTLRELVRVSKKNVIVSVPAEVPSELSQTGLTYAAYLDPTHLRYYTPQKLRSDLSVSGLRNIDIHSTFSVQPILTHLFPLRLRPLIRLLNTVLLHMIKPETNWSVLLGVGYKTAGKND
jgi:ubiquinone/menaquinone biosynthesis C-methylase UbiE